MADRAIRISITYCAECGYAPQALDLTRALMTSFGTRLSKIELIPWHDGSFEVAINGTVVHSMMREGGFPESSTIIDAVKAELVAA
jgi:selenoprotein W-related protein